MTVTDVSDGATLLVRPVDLRPGDRMLLAGEWCTVTSSPFPARWCGRIRLRVTVEGHAAGATCSSWPMDQASRFESVTITARPTHDRRVA